MKLIKHFSLLLLCLSALFLCVACSGTEDAQTKDGETESDTEIESRSETESTDEGVCTLNGVSLSEYTVFAEEGTGYAASRLANGIYELCGVRPEIVTDLQAHASASTSVIRLSENAHDVDYGQFCLSTEENGAIRLCGSSPNSAYYAVCKLLTLYEKEVNIMLNNEEMKGSFSEVSSRTYGTDKLFNADGTLDFEGTEPLTVVYIGGSLTELGDKGWCQGVTDYLREVFPNREITHYNAGVGATTSSGAATRLAGQVLAYEPDLVFVEFTVNDQMSVYNRTVGQMYLEGLLHQMEQAKKIPGVIYLQTPRATDKNTELYRTWCEQRDYKEEWASHYGISTVNIYDYMYRRYTEEKQTKGDNYTFVKFLDKEYVRTKKEGDEIYDVHGGYVWYKEAIIEALQKDMQTMLRPFRHNSYLHEDQKAVIERTHTMISHNDSRITYEGEWKIYTEEAPYGFFGGDNAMPMHRYRYPFLSDGMRVTETAGSSFSLKTTAQTFGIYIMSSRVGAPVKVYADGVLVAEPSCYAVGLIQPLFTCNIDLNNPEGREITVRVVMEETTESAYTYRFGYLFEGFDR